MIGYTWPQVLQFVLHALVVLFMNPVLYLATALIIWDLVRNASAERSFFGVRLTRAWTPLLIRYFKSMCVGFLLTVIALMLHIEVRPGEIFAVAGLSIFLGIIRLRLAATPYAITFMVVAATVSGYLPMLNLSFMNRVQQYLSEVHVESWIQIAAILFIGQFLLIAWSKSAPVAPALVASKRGRELGAVVIQWSFVIPVGVFAPGTLPIPSVFSHFQWLTLAGTIALAAIPGVTGWHGVVSTLNQKQIAFRVMFHSLGCAVLLTGVVEALKLGWLHVLAAGIVSLVIAVLLPEWHVWRIKRHEANHTPICQPTEDGVVVLHAIKGSIAEQVGLKIGEIITHVNQVPVHSEYDLHFALEQNPAYAKLQVVDERGEIRIVGRPVYAGERHRLGAVLITQSGSVPLYRNRPIGLLQTLYLRFLPTNSQPAAVLESSDTFTPPLQG